MRIGEIKTIRIADSRPDFDRACRDAYKRAIDIFGIDEDGHSDVFVRSTDCMRVRFLSMWHTGSMVGHEYIYQFEAWIEREEEE